MSLIWPFSSEDQPQRDLVDQGLEQDLEAFQNDLQSQSLISITYLSVIDEIIARVIDHSKVSVSWDLLKSFKIKVF